MTEHKIVRKMSAEIAFGEFKSGRFNYFLTDINSFQHNYPRSLIRLAKSASSVSGIMFSEGTLAFSDVSSHLLLYEGIEGLKDMGEQVAQFQMDTRGKRQSSSAFNYLFVDIKDISYLKTVCGFLGIGRDIESLSGVLESFSQTALSINGVLEAYGLLSSMSPEAIKNSHLEKSPHERKDLHFRFAAVFDPVCGKLVWGKNHQKAHEKLGYINGRLLMCEHWPLEVLKHWSRYEKPTVHIRYVWEGNKGDVVSLAKMLKSIGFPDTYQIEYHLLAGDFGKDEIVVRKTLKELLLSEG